MNRTLDEILFTIRDSDTTESGDNIINNMQTQGKDEFVFGKTKIRFDFQHKMVSVHYYIGHPEYCDVDIAFDEFKSLIKSFNNKYDK